MRYLRFLLLGLLTLVVLALQARNAPLASADTAAAVTAGEDHSCALTTAGGAKCWGSNWSGQLGDGQACGNSCTTPVDVSGLTSGVAAVAAGDNHTCALTSVGGVKCWGFNGSGQLGDGTTLPRATPLDVSGLTSGVAAVAGGWRHTCALTAAGGVKSWGENGYGQLGDGSTTDRTTPVDVSGLTGGVAAVAAGTWHTCAVTAAGGVKCWGRNDYGQLGDGTTTIRTTAVDVSGLTSGVVAVAAGHRHTCALTTAGGVKCWGRNTYGQLGDGTRTHRHTPVDVSGLGSGVAAVAAGGSHICAVTVAGGVKCWGRNNEGQLGDGKNCGTPCTTPVDVSGLTSGVAVVDAGGAVVSHTCAATTAGAARCWGYNFYGQLGDGTTTTRTTPSVDVLNPGPDSDGDGLFDAIDNCPDTPNAGQENDVHPGTPEGDHCEDPEPDGVIDIEDNCPSDANPGQEDGDGDTVGDACDNCPTEANPGQENNIHPGTSDGDHCDDPEPDGVFDIDDNCPDTPNAGQENSDGDQWGDVCDNCPSVWTPWIGGGPGDDDCDRFMTDHEVSMGTDPEKACAETSTASDEDPPDAWPLDFNDDQRASLTDVIFAFVTTLAPDGLNQPATGPLVRVDFNGDGWINMQDVILGYVTKLAPSGLSTRCMPFP